MKTLRLRILFPLFGILGMFLFSILSGNERLEANNPQADRWQTIEGEWKKPGQAETFLRQVPSSCYEWKRSQARIP